MTLDWISIELSAPGPMALTSEITRGIQGPVPGLVVSSTALDLIPGDPPAKPKPVTTQYAPSGALLERSRARAKSFQIHLGGVLNDVVLPEARLLDGSGEHFWAFDAEPFDGVIDSFYLDKYRFNIPRLSALGLEAENITLTVRELSNHPVLQSLAGGDSKTWLGSVELSGQSVSIPTIPALSLKPQADGGEAFKATYDLHTGDLGVELDRVTYGTKRIKTALTNASLRLSNSAKDISVQGNSELSMPTFGIQKISGDLELRAVDGRMKSLRGSISTVEPITALALAGKLGINYHFKTKAGSIKLTDGLVDGVKVSGSLNYSNSGDATTDLITGQLTVDNSIKRGVLDIVDGLISLRPLQGAIDYEYRPAGAEKPGGTLKFSGVTADLLIGGQELPFSGSLDIKLHPDQAPTLAGMMLNLLQDVDFNLNGLGRVRLEGAAEGPVVQFALAPISGADGLWPTFSGKISLDTRFGTAFTRINSLTSMVDDEIGVPFWRIDGAIGVTA